MYKPKSQKTLAREVLYLEFRSKVEGEILSFVENDEEKYDDFYCAICELCSIYASDYAVSNKKTSINISLQDVRNILGGWNDKTGLELDVEKFLSNAQQLNYIILNNESITFDNNDLWDLFVEMGTPIN